MENDAGGSAQIVLGLASSGDFREARRQVLDVQRTQAETVADAIVEAAAQTHGKRVVWVYGVKQIGAAVRRAKKRFGERMDAPNVVKINARAKQIGWSRATVADVEEVQIGVAAEIGNGAQPRLDVVGDGGAATVEAEAANAGRAGIGAQIGITGEDIDFVFILRFCWTGKERRECE